MAQALRWRQQHRGWEVFGWVVLENHLHLLVQANDLPDEIAAFKSWTARLLIDWLSAHQVTRILDQLVWFKKVHKADRTHQLWEEGNHPQVIQSDDMMRVYAGQPGLLEVDRSWWTG